mmetsp:Transcript_8236/g.30429  ORF Transcript_8236/g.30429 Transcript_8236/m.30429 type:complete len:180 (-) Transcript_8236:2466-3005(-)
MAELHIIGQLLNASQFKQPSLFVIFHIESGSKWKHCSGLLESQTQVSQKNSKGEAILAHPIDVLFSTSSCIGWPKISCEVWFQDKYGRNDFAGYGVLNVPTANGMHEVECVCWRPVGGFLDRISEGFVGGMMQVRDKSIIHNGEDRHKLTTWSVGKLRFRLGVMGNFSKFGIEMGEKRE